MIYKVIKKEHKDIHEDSDAVTISSLKEEGWEFLNEFQVSDGYYLIFGRKDGFSLEAEVQRLKEENIKLQNEYKRLVSEIQEPRCHGCNSILGDNWCADCASRY